MRYFLLIGLLSASFFGRAGTGDSLRYVFSVNSSMTFCAKCSQEGSVVAMPATIHGIQWRRWRVGGGVGYTGFGQIRAMPYFGSVTLNLFGKKAKNGIFFECNYGAAHAWLGPLLQSAMYLESVKATNFLQISTGYAYHHHKLRLAAQIGFQSLDTKTKYEYGDIRTMYDFTDTIYLPPANTLTDYNVRRLFLSISFGL